MREMKDSGIEWVGEIPKYWHTHKIKNNFKIISGSGFDIRLQGNISGEVPICKASDISNAGHYLKYSENYLSYSQAIANGFEIIPKGSVLFPKIGEAMRKNRRTLTCVQCGADNNCQAIVPNNIISNYSYYMMSCIDMVWFDNNGTVPCINNVRFKNSKFPYPPIEEQQKIADFLDEKCTEIDSIISDIQQQIKTLEQYKRSVITEAVTKGLNPDVEMRDSGIKWIGDIPKHWITHPIYYYFDERKNKNVLGLETNLLSLSYGKIIRKDINSNGGLLPESFNTYNIVEKDDIIIRPTDLQNDKRSLRTGIAREHGIITSAYIAMKAIKDISPEYFHYLLHAYDIMKVFYNMGNGVRQSLNFSEFSRLMVLEPPIEEQNAIVSFLSEKCSEIDFAIAEKKRQIETIEEYKKSLIFEYVTGKKEVSND